MSKRKPFQLVHLIRPGVILFFFIPGLVLILTANIRSAQTHGAPIIDGMFTGDWCAPGFVGAFGPDTFMPLVPPGCPLGTEFFWEDWDAVTYGGGVADTMGWVVGGAPGAPLTDLETDIDFFATTADATTVFFAVTQGMFPSTGGTPPHIQIAIDLDGPAGGNAFWYDPLPAGTGALGGVPALFPDYLIISDVVGATGWLLEATTTPGVWTPVGPVPLAWSGLLGPGPGIIEASVPWAMFAPGPAFGPGVPVHMTVMSSHSAAGPLGGSAAPGTPEDDVFSEAGAGFTTSPDICAPGPPTSDCELFFGPGGGGGSADAFVFLTYPLPATPTPTTTPTDTATATATIPTATPTATVPTTTPTVTGTPPTATPTVTGTPPTPTPTATPTAPYSLELPIILREEP